MTCTTSAAARRSLRHAASALLIAVVALTCGAMSTPAHGAFARAPVIPAAVTPAGVIPAAIIPAAITPAAGDDGSTTDTVSSGYADNPFIPENQNFGDCASSLPRPDCGSEAQGGPPQLLTLAALMLGMAFIGWRISVGVRKRDRRPEPDATASSDRAP